MPFGKENNSPLSSHSQGLSTKNTNNGYVCRAMKADLDGSLAFIFI